jgi:hypothetical protein
MTRRRQHLVLALLLPLLALRALLPVGYMPVADAHGLRLILCDAGRVDRITQHDDPVHHDPAHHAAHHDAAHHDAAPHDPAHHGQPGSPSDCPFAHAAFNAPPPHLASGAIATAPELHFVVRSFQNLRPLTGPPRQASARAPPPSGNSLI